MVCDVNVVVAAVDPIEFSVWVPPWCSSMRVVVPLMVAFSLCLFLVYVLAVEEAGSACTFLLLVYIYLSVVYAVRLLLVWFSATLSIEFALANLSGSP